MAHNTAAYFWEEGGPGNIEKHIADIQASGLTTVILIALHVGRKMPHSDMKVADLMYNDYENLLVSDGVFNPNKSDAIKAWPKQIAQLKEPGSSVSKVFISIGGPGGHSESDVWDFRIIQCMFNLGMADTLTKNIKALKEGFTVNGVCAIDGFDIDCEEQDCVEEDTIVQFCRMLFEQRFEVTFCPFADWEWWKNCMQPLWHQGRKVSWWNLQCYSGGSGNRKRETLELWLNALSAVVSPLAPSSFLVPGLAVKGAEDVFPPSQRQCPTGPDSFVTTFGGWNDLHLTGGFLWRYDGLVNNPNLCSGQNHLSAYVKAINNGLDNKSA
jgi:hypothetical protein